MEWLLIVVSLAGLWLGTRWIINSALQIALHFGMSQGVVGLAILAVGTDLPEVFVSIKASLDQYAGTSTSGIITGNAIGSSLCQISIILGIAALVTTFKINSRELYREGGTLLASVVILYLMGSDGTISRKEGMLLILIYIFYYWLLLRTREQQERNDAEKLPNPIFTWLLLLLGLVTLIGASHVVVDNAVSLSNQYGLEQSFAGAVIVGLGTSLPELAVSLGAALKKSPGLSVGNILGSNIFDGLIPIGLGATIHPIEFHSNLLKYDLPILAGITLLCLFILKTKRGLSLIEGLILILCFLTFIFVKYQTST